MKIPNEVRFVLDALKQKGFPSYLVGGCVRDSRLGREPKDYDIASLATPEEVISIFERVVPTGIKHGTVTVFEGDWGIEVTTFRKDGSYSDGRRPDEVTYSKSILEDLSRRDFTMNAMAYDGNAYLDPFMGMWAMMDKLIKTVGNASDRFSEDALRMMRAVRFMTQLDFNLEGETFHGIKDNAHLIENVSQERIRDELVKILMSDNASKGIEMLQYTGLLKHILPELEDCKGFDQHNPHHDKDVFGHILEVLKNTPAILEVRLSALLHDIAKPVTFSLDDNGIGHFYTHEYVGAAMAHEIMRRLKFDNDTTEKVCTLVNEHMSKYDQFRTATAKKLINRVGVDNIDNLFHLQIADIKGHVLPHNIDIVTNMKNAVDDILSEDQPLSVKDLALNGNDIMSMGFKAGRIIGKILETLLGAVLENPSLNNKETLREIVKQEFEAN
ncbi:CCA tRNA nucleotidyltransferase [Paenibacillus odorifer]|uniref:CCA tRNA nucleotidyltransferase n=1 Tax=Paenibacillus odorifer TaxID=189426 RepID=UPI001C4CA53A|nr:HD domain-containing protein [Paenibacillus odorifer]